MQLRLYNTLTRRKETFAPIDPANVRMYVCGPTVYDFAHIGNARPAIVFDVLFRLLRHLYGESHVTYVRNITDVDDKINARALRDYGDRISRGEMSLNDAIRQVTERTAKQYHEDVAALGCLPPTVEPRATEHIAGMVAMIQQLLDKGHAYLAAGGEGAEILFDVDSMPDYGVLSKRRLEDQQAGARVAVENHKKNPADFVLWKESAANQPGWEGTFKTDGGTVAIHGRPGWHIECSVMSEAHLGATFDIHGGGLDLIFPHHENEIAQSRCAHDGAAMANVWMHNGFVQVEGKKMAKSEGNFVTIHDLLHTDKFGGRKWPGEVLRLAMLMTHYREPIDFSAKRLEEAESTVRKYRQSLDLLIERAVISVNHVEGEYDIEPRFDPPNSTDWTNPPFVLSLFDDLNTPALKSQLDHAARGVREGHFNEADENTFGDHLVFVNGINLLGIFLHDSVESIDEELVQTTVEQRLSLLAEKNFAQADAIRDELAVQGIQLMDYKDPETGERRTKWEVKR